MKALVPAAIAAAAIAGAALLLRRPAPAAAAEPVSAEQLRALAEMLDDGHLVAQALVDDGEIEHALRFAAAWGS
jgi:predicted secreted protein